MPPWYLVPSTTTLTNLENERQQFKGINVYHIIRFMTISDTSKEARKIVCDIYCRMSPARKIELVFDACRTGQLLSMAGIRNQYPSAGENEVWHIWAKRHLGEELYNKVYGRSEK